MIFYEDILREFQKQRVKYVLVGGIAINLLGGLRSTSDLDVMVEMSDRNLEKVVKILTNKGYTVKQPVDPIRLADKKTRADWIKNKHMKAFNFFKEDELKEVDIIIDSPVDFKQAKKTAQIVKCDDLQLPVISIDNLIKMKKASNRKVDQIDIAELTKIKHLRKKIP